MTSGQAAVETDGPRGDDLADETEERHAGEVGGSSLTKSPRAFRIMSAMSF